MAVSNGTGVKITISWQPRLCLAGAMMRTCRTGWFRKNYSRYSAFHAVQVKPWLRRLVAGLSPDRYEFNPRLIHVGFVVDNVAFGQVPLRLLLLSCQYHPTNALYTCTYIILATEHTLSMSYILWLLNIRPCVISVTWAQINAFIIRHYNLCVSCNALCIC